MAAFPQWWLSDKSAQITAESAETIAAGVTGSVTTVYLFNDKGSLLGATSMSGYYLIIEASIDGGTTWLRSGLQILDERWVEVSITGTVDSTGGAPAAQTTAYTALGTGSHQSVTAIPQGSGRQISYRVNVPLGASDAGIKWRIVESSASPVLTPVDISLQRGVLVFLNSGGAIYHRLVSQQGTSVLPTYCSRITGASASDVITPYVTSGVNFTNGFGIDNASKSDVHFNVAAQTEADLFAIANATWNSTGDVLTVEPRVTSLNINGTTRARFVLRLRLASSNALWEITTANIANGEFLFLNWIAALKA